MPARAQAQWWSSREPVDYEDCLAQGEKSAATADAKTALASQCDARFAGRRKPGGGYTYFDFMQNRSFDIAGPNPTAEELRKMDEHYTEFLDQRRKMMIATAFAAKQQQLATLQQQPAETAPAVKPRLAVDKPQRPAKPRPVAVKRTAPDKPPPQRKPHYACNNDPLSCGWTHLSNGISAVKTSLFGAAAAK